MMVCKNEQAAGECWEGLPAAISDYVESSILFPFLCLLYSVI
jgi:hypothetical protein